jgi:eukaryotic-like serine/threonine-protein kinase
VRDDLETIDASGATLAPVTPGTAKVTHPDDYVELIVIAPEHYVFGAELARGGMGRIVRAHDRRLGRDVAIKELLQGHDVVRFEREARITARLAHPAIVAIHEAGRWPSGEPFFAMKLVAGTSLDKRLAATQSFAERLALVPNVIAAVDALAYAHDERVIHRDLKPANILVGNYAETVVIDWGLAKDLRSSDADELSVGPFRGGGEGETVAGAVMGTPAYMPPEQADGDPVDERADVYALGALLYHVLAGKPPYGGKTTEAVLAAVLKGPPPPLAEVVPEAPIELGAIVDKAMARVPDDRFASARPMADELRRFQTGQLVTSHRYTAGELVRRWLRRHRAPVAVGAIAFVTLAVAGVASVAKIVAEQRRADREAADATARADRGTLERARALLDTDPTAAVAALADLGPGAPEWRAARTVIADARARGIARVLHDDGAPITDLAFSADGAYLAAIAGSELIAWNLDTGVTGRLLGAGELGSPRTFAWSGHDILHVDWRGRLGRWHPFASGDDLVLPDVDHDSLDLAPGGRYLATADNNDGEVLELATGRRIPIGVVQAFAWDRDGHTLLVFDRRAREIRRVDVATGTTMRFPFPHEGVHALAMAGERIYAGDFDGTFVAGGSAWPTGQTGAVAALVALPDGRLASAISRAGSPVPGELVDRTDEAVVTISDGSTDVARLLGHRASVKALAVSPSGQLASGDNHGEVRIWTRTPVAFKHGHDRVPAAFLDVARAHLVVAHAATATSIDLATGATSTTERTFGLAGPLPKEYVFPVGDDSTLDAPRFAARAARSDRWITIDLRDHAWVWDAATGGRELCEDTGLAVISADGTRVATFDHDQLHEWDARTGSGSDENDHTSAAALAIAPDGSQVAVGTEIAQLLLYRGGTSRAVEMPKQATDASALAFSADGTVLAAGFDTDIRIVTVATGDLRVLRGHEGAIVALRFVDDGRLVSTSTDRTVRVWDVAAGTSHVLRGHTAPVTTVDVVGDRAVTVGADHGVRLWDIPSEVGRPLVGHDAAPVFAGFTANGEVIAVDEDGRLSRYRDDTPPGEAALRVWIAALTAR